MTHGCEDKVDAPIPAFLPRWATLFDVAVMLAHAKNLEDELSDLRERLLAMAGRVEDMIHRAGRALVERNETLAQETIELDGLVNVAEMEIDDFCQRVLAAYQPMGIALRKVTAALKMVTDLERLGDLAVNICERAIDLGRAEQIVVHPELPRMTRAVESMVQDAVDAFVTGDIATAWTVIERDDDVDALYRRIFADSLVRMRAEPRDVHQLIHVQSVAKWLERMADHATNLAETVIFILEGRDVRHARAGRPAAVRA